MKICNKCGLEQEFSAFSKRCDSYGDGYASRCKSCVRRYSREYYQSNKDKVNAGQREYYSKNATTIRLKHKEYYQNNKSVVRERYVRLYSENSERYRGYRHSYRTLKQKAGSFSILDKELKALYSSPCRHCGATDNITADHIIPIALGGRHSIGNLQPLCVSCNSSKGKKLWVVFRLGYAKS